MEKKMKKNRILLLLVLILFSFSSSMLISSVVEPKGPITASIETDEEKYETNQSVEMILNVFNRSAFSVPNVSIELKNNDSFSSLDNSLRTNKEFQLSSNQKRVLFSAFRIKDSDENDQTAEEILINEKKQKLYILAELLFLTISIIMIIVLLNVFIEKKRIIKTCAVLALLVGIIAVYAKPWIRACVSEETIYVQKRINWGEQEIILSGEIKYSLRGEMNGSEQDVYAVYFQMNGGDSILPKYVKKGECLIPPEYPQREGYSFDGWFKDKSLEEQYLFTDEPVYEDMVLYAKWGDGKTTLDSDEDGIYDLDEVAFGSDPYKKDDYQTDTDEDGICDYYESYVTYTSVVEADTDGDGLTDYQEVKLTGSDPNNADTDGNGTDDFHEDFDKDELINGEEIICGTDPLNDDSDFDGLQDKEELSEYKTDPNNIDTDGDGAEDGWEKSNGYDPMVFNHSFNISVKKKETDGKLTASVELAVAGNPMSVEISETNECGNLTDKMPGWIGSAFSFSTEGEFDNATISFEYDPALLPENAEPTIYYYNESTQVLEALPTSVENGIAKTTVSHFSTYVLLNKRAWESVWDEEIIAPDTDAYNNSVFNVAFVIDYSSSMNDNDPNGLRLSIAKDFIGKLRDDQDQATVVKFAGYATVLAGLTKDKEMLKNAVAGITIASSSSCDSEAGTNGSDGLHAALEELHGKKADESTVIFLTDGEDTTSSYDYDELIQAAISDKIKIYTIGLGDANEELLAKIANQTGGKYYRASAVDLEDFSDNSLMDAFYDIGITTIDRETDSNSDGISDYYSKLICDGRLVTGTGIPMFDGYSFEQIQADMNGDIDQDGLKNGEEIVIKYDEKTKKTYLYVVSSPVMKDTDQDGIRDKNDTAPLEKGLAGGVVGEVALCAVQGVSTIELLFNCNTGHTLLLYSSFVNDTIDLSKMNYGFADVDGSWKNCHYDANNANYAVKCKDILTLSAGGATNYPTKMAIYNMEIWKSYTKEFSDKNGHNYRYYPSAYIVHSVTQKELDHIIDAFGKAGKGKYSAPFNNCTHVCLNVWNSTFGTNLDPIGLNTPTNLCNYLLKEKNVKYNIGLRETIGEIYEGPFS